jgi:hypothetical protein
MTNEMMEPDRPQALHVSPPRGNEQQIDSDLPKAHLRKSATNWETVNGFAEQQRTRSGSFASIDDRHALGDSYVYPVSFMDTEESMQWPHSNQYNNNNSTRTSTSQSDREYFTDRTPSRADLQPWPPADHSSYSVRELK